MTKGSSQAGGRAVEAGMAFQASVGAWFAAHLASAMPVGAKLGIAGGPTAVALRFETGWALDDIEVELSDGRFVLVQCKTNAAVSPSADSALGRTVDQLVEIFEPSVGNTNQRLNDKYIAVLAVSNDSPRSMEGLERACRAMDSEEWGAAYARSSAETKQLLDVLREQLVRAWRARYGVSPSDVDLSRAARTLHIVRFDVDFGGADWREASRIVGARLFGDAGNGEAPLQALLAYIRRLVRSGAATDGHNLVSQLREQGFEDTHAPKYDKDIALLRRVTKNELERLRRHRILPISGGVPIRRECMAKLEAASDEGSLLVTGEPGAGKTGVLVELAENKLDQGHPVVLLSVDQFPGVATKEALRQELGLQHQLVDILMAWPGNTPGLLVIDALDASRGGAFEAVIASLMEDTLRVAAERWSIIASVRTFDLVNGRRFRSIVRGEAPATEFSDPSLSGVRHFRVGCLSDDELDRIGDQAPELSKLLKGAPTNVVGMLRNIFNLSLAAQLLEGGRITVENLSTIEAQGELIGRYEDERMRSGQLKRALAEAVGLMVAERRLMVRRVSLANELTDELIASGVLVQSGERVAFAHHVLFDHAASRFYLSWDDVDKLQAQVGSDPTIGLLLGPALRFAMDTLWREDTSGRPASWRLLATICSLDGVDPVVASVALRTSAERVSVAEDSLGLCVMLDSPSRVQFSSAQLGGMLSRLARFAGMTSPTDSPEKAQAWAEVARCALASNQHEFIDGARVLLWNLFASSLFKDPLVVDIFGQAARNLLNIGLADETYSPILVGSAIRFTAKTYSSNKAHSRSLLSRIFEPERFEAHAHEEVPWLAESVASIYPSDPEFASDIYRVVYSRPGPQEGTTWIGGSPSRILPLTSTRKQEYEHARWHLQRALPGFLQSSASWGTLAVNRSLIGEHDLADPDAIVVRLDGSAIAIINDSHSWEEWRPSDRRPHESTEKSVLSVFSDYLISCSKEDFSAAFEAIVSEKALSASVLARLLGVAGDRPEITDARLWEVASQTSTLEVSGLARDCISFLASRYSSLNASIRAGYEESLLSWMQSDEQDRHAWRSAMVGRLLSALEPNAIVTEKVRDLRARMDRDGLLRGNTPFVSFSSTWTRDGKSVTDSMLEDRGVDLTQGPDSLLRDPARRLSVVLGNKLEDSSTITLAWSITEELLAVIDSHATVDEITLRSSWGEIGSAVDKILSSGSYDPSVSGHPDLNRLYEIVCRLAASPYPEPDETNADGSSMAWGNWDIRVYAASSLLALLKRHSSAPPESWQLLRRLLLDPTPAVRLQIAQGLNTLWDVDRQRMWELVELVASQEQNSGVLAFFVSGPISRLAGAEPERCERLIERIIAVVQSKPAREKRDSLHESLGYLAAQFWVGLGRAKARAWIDSWISDVVVSRVFLWSVLSSIRSALFSSFSEDADAEDVEIQARAHATLDCIARASLQAAKNFAESLSTEPNNRDLITAYQAADGLIDHACNQLYFGSGAFRPDQTQGGGGLTSLSAKARFLAEYKETLEAFRESNSAKTVHQLIELYEYLIPGNPAAVFDAVAEILTGAGAEGGYHYESLGSDSFVKFIRLYLADYRSIFDDQSRRASLLVVLELFSTAGWPEALKLLYELPDLLR